MYINIDIYIYIYFTYILEFLYTILIVSLIKLCKIEKICSF